MRVVRADVPLRQCVCDPPLGSWRIHLLILAAAAAQSFVYVADVVGEAIVDAAVAAVAEWSLPVVT